MHVHPYLLIFHLYKLDCIHCMKIWTHVEYVWRVCRVCVCACEDKIWARRGKIKHSTPVKDQKLHCCHAFVNKQYMCFRHYINESSPLNVKGISLVILAHQLFFALSSSFYLLGFEVLFLTLRVRPFPPWLHPCLALHSCWGRAACIDMPLLFAHTAWLNNGQTNNMKSKLKEIKSRRSK